MCKNIVKEIRSKAELSSEKFGLALGLSKSVTSQWETGRAKPSIRTAEKIVDVFGSVAPQECEELLNVIGNQPAKATQSERIGEAPRNTYEIQYQDIKPDAVMTAEGTTVVIHDYAKTARGNGIVLAAIMVSPHEKKYFRLSMIRKDKLGRKFIVKAGKRFYFQDALYILPELYQTLLEES